MFKFQNMILFISILVLIFSVYAYAVDDTFSTHINDFMISHNQDGYYIFIDPISSDVFIWTFYSVSGNAKGNIMYMSGTYYVTFGYFFKYDFSSNSFVDYPIGNGMNMIGLPKDVVIITNLPIHLESISYPSYYVDTLDNSLSALGLIKSDSHAIFEPFLNNIFLSIYSLGLGLFSCFNFLFINNSNISPLAIILITSIAFSFVILLLSYLFKKRRF